MGLRNPGDLEMLIERFKVFGFQIVLNRPAKRRLPLWCRSYFGLMWLRAYRVSGYGLQRG